MLIPQAPPVRPSDPVRAAAATPAQASSQPVEAAQDTVVLGGSAPSQPVPDKTPQPQGLRTLGEAMQASQAHLLAMQSNDGAWRARNESGTRDTAQVLVVERFVGTLDAQEAAEAVKFLRSRQLPDGSWAPYPTASQGNLESTCFGYAGLLAAGVPESDPAVVQARARIDALGGMDAAHLDAKLFLALAGAMEPKELPFIPLTQKLVPGAEKLMGKRLGSWVTLGTNTMPALIRILKRGGRLPSSWLHPLQNVENRNVVDYLTQHQNPIGDWYGVTLSTALSVATLHALGIPMADPRIQKALAQMNRMKIQQADGMHVVPFTSENWDTALAVHALLESGLAASDPRIGKAGEFLVGQQGKLDTPTDWQNPKPGAPTRDAWGFGQNNPLAPDNDTTSVVLLALDDIAQAGAAPASRDAIDKGVAREMGMQNPDGGWGAWTYGHASKDPGCMPPNPMTRLLGFPILVTDPSTEDVTGRVLQMLGRHGYSTKDAEVRDAISFIKGQRDENGVWWGRWFVNYLNGTAHVLSGLKAVGEDMGESYVRDAATFLKGHQNADGGFGEMPGSYEEIREAGRGMSTPTTTALVVRALLDAGDGDSPQVRKGIDYLLRTQKADGSWEDTTTPGVMFPSLSMYYQNEMLPQYYALEALARYQACLAGK